MARPISAEDMYEHLAREFEKARAPHCTTCRMPRPFWGPAAGPGASGYWYLETPAKCARGCRETLARVWAQLTTDYEIAAPSRQAIISGVAFAG
jgi:hypothetical protein